MGTFVCTYAGQILNEDMANKVRFHVIILWTKSLLLKGCGAALLIRGNKARAKVDFTWLILSLFEFIMAWLLVTLPLNLWKKSYGLTIQIKSRWQNFYMVFLTFGILLKEIWNCCDCFTFATIGGKRINFRWKLPFFIHQNLYFKLIDSSCSLFCATDVAKQSNIRFKEAALLLSSRRATSGLDKGKTSSGGRLNQKLCALTKVRMRALRQIKCTGNRTATET